MPVFGSTGNCHQQSVREHSTLAVDHLFPYIIRHHFDELVGCGGCGGCGEDKVLPNFPNSPQARSHHQSVKRRELLYLTRFQQSVYVSDGRHGGLVNCGFGIDKRTSHICARFIDHVQYVD